MIALRFLSGEKGGIRGRNALQASRFEVACILALRLGCSLLFCTLGHFSILHGKKNAVLPCTAVACLSVEALLFVCTTMTSSNTL